MGPAECRAVYHLPGLFEFYELYRVFLPLYRAHRDYFYDWCRIGSIYGAPEGCLWGGGRVGIGTADPRAVLGLTREFGMDRVYLTQFSAQTMEKRISKEEASCPNL